MTKYAAFLRGINVAGQRKIKMVDLREALELRGLHNVETYVQSGNVIFETPENQIQPLQKLLETCILEDFGFTVPVLVKTAPDLQQILTASPYLEEAAPKQQYFALLFEEPDNGHVSKFTELQFEHEDFRYSPKCVYLNYKNGAGKATLTNNLIEKKLGVAATTRNLRTLKKMIALFGE